MTTLPRFVHRRHEPPTPLVRDRQLVIVCPPLRSGVNGARIVRAAGCCGVTRVIMCGARKIDAKIARDALEHVQLETPRSIAPVLKRLRDERYDLVGLEQTTNSTRLFDYPFQLQTALIIGHERNGLNLEILKLVDHVVEIPVYGMPYSHNVATAAAIAMYEYCRQYPDG